MALYLVQHGKSLSKEMDPEQGLSADGISDVERVAEVAAGYHVKVSQIMHSGKKRARQTAEIFASFLKPESGVLEKAGLKPMDDVAAWVDKIDTADNMMLVGHLPFMEQFTSLLVTGSADKSVFKFQNGGIVCLDIDPDSGSWIIKWTLMPNIS